MVVVPFTRLAFWPMIEVYHNRTKLSLNLRGNFQDEAAGGGRRLPCLAKEGMRLVAKAIAPIPGKHKPV